MKKIVALVCAVALILAFTGCSQAERVSYNLSKEADNFNQVRQLTFINCITGEVLFQATGKMSIEVDEVDNQLEVVSEEENGKYKKHFFGLSPVVTYTCEDISEDDVSNTKFTINFNPDMILPYEVTTIE